MVYFCSVSNRIGKIFFRRASVACGVNFRTHKEGNNRIPKAYGIHILLLYMYNGKFEAHAVRTLVFTLPEVLGVIRGIENFHFSITE